MKVKFHATDLDSIVWYQKIDAMTVEEMRSRLLRTEPANDKMKMGTAWHSILEDPPDEINTIEKDGFTFKVECDSEIILPQIREIRAGKTYIIDSVDATLTGGCDGITGNKTTDHKLTFRENVDTYFESYQWRAYLDIYNTDVFEYILYSAKLKKEVVFINNISSIKMYRYPKLTDDLRIGIKNLLDFVKDYVPELLR